MVWSFLTQRTSPSQKRDIKKSLTDEDDDDDAQLLLPTSNGITHKHIPRRIKYSLSYLLLSGAASFGLVMMIWLGPGLVKKDPKGMATQSNAHLGYLEDHIDPSTSSPIIPVASNSTSRPKLSVTKPPVERKPLPHHSWNPLLYDPAPITHVYVKPCMFPPWAFPSFCAPSQSAREIALYGKWVRVPRDLSKGVGHYYTEIYYRRAQTLDLSTLDTKPITGLRILEDSQLNDPSIQKEIRDHGWYEAGDDLRTGIWPSKVPSAKLWYTRSPTFDPNMPNVQPINEINVLWSPKSHLTQPWWGFERLDHPVFEGDNEMNHIQCDIVVRRELIEPPTPPSLSFQKDGTFKIMQISDLHFSAAAGKCHPTMQSLPSCEKDGADFTTMEWLALAISESKPDLIVLGGDQLLGNGKTFDTISTLTKIAHFFEKQNVPWTLVFGNHDADRSLAIEEQMYLFKHMPNFLGRAGPGVPGFDEENLPLATHLSDMGVGNYVLKVNASRSDPTQLLSLYFLDSHDYAKTTFSQVWELAMGGDIKFDWLKKSQIKWYKEESNKQPKILRPYKPTQDYQAKAKVTTSNLKKPTGLMFFHIPLPEAYGTSDINPKTNGAYIFGNQKEKPLSSEPGDEFFQNAILSTSVDGIKTSNDTGFEPEIKVIANGHAHMTDTCRKHKGVYHCFSGLGSYAGKVKTSSSVWERRVRVFEVKEFGESIETYELKHSLEDVQQPRVVKFGALELYHS